MEQYTPLHLSQLYWYFFKEPLYCLAVVTFLSFTRSVWCSAPNFQQVIYGLSIIFKKYFRNKFFPGRVFDEMIFFFTF